jgi:hypothetical protein
MGGKMKERNKKRKKKKKFWEEPIAYFPLILHGRIEN